MKSAFQLILNNVDDFSWYYYLSPRTIIKEIKFMKNILNRDKDDFTIVVELQKGIGLNDISIKRVKYELTKSDFLEELLFFLKTQIKNKTYINDKSYKSLKNNAYLFHYIEK